MSSAIRVMVMVDCDGGCGVLVRPDAEKRLCGACLELDRLYQERMVRDGVDRIYAQRDGVDRIYAQREARLAPLRQHVREEQTRAQMGVVPFERQHPEEDNGCYDYDEEPFKLSAILAGMKRRDQIASVVLCFVAVVGLGSLVLLARWIVQLVGARLMTLFS